MKDIELEEKMDTIKQIGRVSQFPFNKEKIKELLHYIISQCGHNPNVGKTVLYKLLYFSDFDYYELTEEPLTGESYLKKSRGPAPTHFKEIIAELVQERKVWVMESEYAGYRQIKYLSIQAPNINLLSGKELQVVNNVIGKCAHMTATQISAYSHKDMPYKATGDGQLIDYELVFYREPITSVREYPND